MSVIWCICSCDWDGKRWSWCVTGAEWEELKNITSTDLWPIRGTRGAWPIHYLPLFLSLSLSHTFPCSACAHTCRWGLWLGNERRHGWVGVEPVAKHVRRCEVEDRPWQTAHLQTEGHVQKLSSNHNGQVLFIYLYIFFCIFSLVLQLKQTKTGNRGGGGRGVGHMVHLNCLATWRFWNITSRKYIKKISYFFHNFKRILLVFNYFLGIIDIYYVNLKLMKIFFNELFSFFIFLICHVATDLIYLY